VKIVNCFPGGPDESWQLVLRHPDGSRTLVQQTYDYFRPDGTRVQSRTYRDREQKLLSEPKALEADLGLTRRYLADHPEVEIAKPRRVYLDLETDPTPGFNRKHEMRVIVACAVGEDGARFVGVLESFDDAGEAALLQKLFAFLKAYDVIVSWNGGSSWGTDGFDFVILRARCEHLWSGSSRRLNRWLFLDHLRAYKRLHLLFAETGDERSSYSLDAVSKFVLGEGKIEYDAKNTLKDWEAGGQRRLKLIEYCAQDCDLLPRIEAKTGILDLAYEVARLCGCLHDTTGLHPTTFVDSYLLRLAGQRGIRLPTKPREPKHVKRGFAGAFVFEPQAVGIERNIFATDLSSLYPSIYLMLNASPETKGKPGCVSPQTGITFAQDPQGIFPEFFAHVGALKKHWKAEYRKHPEGTPEHIHAKQTHDAAKSILNSGYGYGGSEYSRMRDKEIAESITLTGQFIIKTIAKEIEARGWTVLQGDTDSTYIKGATEEQVREFLAHINGTVLPSIAKAHRCERPPPVLEFDAAYDRVVVVGKKKYACKYRDSDEIVFRGLEFRRGDASPLARQLQERVARKLMSDAQPDPEDYTLTLIEMRSKVLYEELGKEEIVMSESIRKELDEYEATSPALSVARLLQSRGEDVSPGTKVHYVILDGSVSPMQAVPLSDYDGSYDRYYYWEHLIYPPTQRLLMAAFPTYDWEQFAKVRPAKEKVCAERKYQDKLEKRGQRRLFEGF
jgi:DNA polymerase elongation subunit (family B)